MISMLTKSDLEKLAQVRLEGALFLLQAHRLSSAYYLAGYAVELALKACIAKQMLPNVIPDKELIKAIYTHNLYSLLSTAGLRPQFNEEIRADTQFAVYWMIAKDWDEESRYAFWDQDHAAALLEAVNEPNHGVFQWVKRYW
jgi:HEPN domain-containing protein